MHYNCMCTFQPYISLGRAEEFLLEMNVNRGPLLPLNTHPFASNSPTETDEAILLCVRVFESATIKCSILIYSRFAFKTAFKMQAVKYPWKEPETIWQGHSFIVSIKKIISHG